MGTNPLIYRLYTGSSTDGRGTPKYLQSTPDRKVAAKHLKYLASSPYLFGHVIITYETTEDYYFHMDTLP